MHLSAFHTMWACFIDSFAGSETSGLRPVPNGKEKKVLSGQDTTSWFVIVLREGGRIKTRH